MSHEHEHTHIYILENLGCANCAAKMERKISALDGVTCATITFATKQLRITAQHPEQYLTRIREICSSIESQVTVTEAAHNKSTSSAHEYEHAQDCGCEHDHEHPHDCKCEHNHEHSHDCDCEHDHEHSHDCGWERNHEHDHNHSHSHTHGSGDELKKDLTVILTGAVLFLMGEILERIFGIPAFVPAIVYIAAYLLLGGEILLTAGRNILKGQIFDENFLMSIATLGALIIGQFDEAVGVMLFFRIGEYFEHVAVEKSRSQIMEAVDLRPEVVNLIRGEEVFEIDAAEANPGDLLLVRPGDRIPLDGVVIEGESRIDTSPITGEPVPVKVTIDSPVTSGCVNTSGQLKIRVEKPLSESMVTRILDSVENAAASKPKIHRFITRFSRIYTPIVVLLALGTAVIPSLFTGDWNYWVYTALTFLVMSCPCALVLSVPLAFFCGIGAGSKKGILFKSGLAMEAMTNIRAVVMDKTGTITKGNFVLQKSVPAGALSENELLALCAGCEQNSTHPIAISITAAAQQKGLKLETPASLEEIAGHGIRAQLSEGEVLCGNRKLMDQFHVTLKDHVQETFGSEVFVAVNGIFAGYLIISDTLKPDAGTAVRRLKQMNITTAMLTGDAEESARAVAAETGIDEVHARLLPEDKLNRLGDIRKKHGAVMFVGDGINDAPVLAGADVGAAMGSGADAAIEAADVVFMTSAMEAIPKSLSIARSTSRIAMQNVVFALIIKIAVMILGLLGFASMWMAVFADTGVAMLCILNSIRILYRSR